MRESVCKALVVAALWMGSVAAGVLSLSDVCGSKIRTSAKGQEVSPFQASYEGILRDSLEGLLLGPSEIERLRASNGRRVGTTKSLPLLGMTQDAIDLLIKHAEGQGSSREELNKLFAIAMDQVFGTSEETQKKQTARRAKYKTLKLIGEDRKPRQIVAVIPNRAVDIVYVVSAEGDVYSHLFRTMQLNAVWTKIYSHKRGADASQIPLIRSSPDGTHLAVDDGHTLTLLNSVSGKELWSRTGCAKYDMAFSPDGQRLATVSATEPLLIFDVRRGSVEEFRYAYPQDRALSIWPYRTTSDDWLKDRFHTLRFDPSSEVLLMYGKDEAFFATSKDVHRVHNYGMGSRMWGIHDGSILLIDSFKRPWSTDTKNAAWDTKIALNIGQVALDELNGRLYMVHPDGVSIFRGKHANHKFILEEDNRFWTRDGSPPISGLLLAPQGQFLAVETAAEVEIWDVRDPNEAKPIVGQFGPFPIGRPGIRTTPKAGFSGTGRYFVGVEPTGELYFVDIARYAASHFAR